MRRLAQRRGRRRNPPSVVVERASRSLSRLRGAHLPEDIDAEVRAVFGSRQEVAAVTEKHGGYDIAQLVKRSKARKVAYIEWLTTSVPRRGYGRSMLRLALDRLHTEGVREAFLAAEPDRRRISNSDLQRFYRSLGFQHWVSDPSVMMARLPWKPVREEYQDE